MIIIGVFPHKRLRIVNDWYYYWILLDQDTRERYTARIERIRESFGLQVFYQNVTREEKDLIVKAMGLAQGHWFKCPKGENYCQSSLVPSKQSLSIGLQRPTLSDHLSNKQLYEGQLKKF